MTRTVSAIQYLFNGSKYYSLFIILIIIPYACNGLLNNNDTVSKADAGEDQETYVGSYVIFNPTKSTISTSENISIIKWDQDIENPEEILLLEYSSLTDPFVAGFYKEGTYNFTLNIKCTSGNVYTDEMSVIVKPRQPSLIEDINLEIQTRYRLYYKEGDLNADKLLMLDSLFINVPFFNVNKIISLAGIKYCTNLIYLILNGQNISDLRPLSELVNLEYLDLSTNYAIEDIAPIYNLVNLKKLYLYASSIEDISVLANLTQLKELYLWDTPVSDINSLSKLENLEMLYIDGVGTGVNFNSIEPLKALLNLRHLDLAGRGINSLIPLENLVELELLNASCNNLTNIYSIANMKKLIRLIIFQNQVEDITGIKNLENLDYLDATDNQIRVISELQYLGKIHLIGLDKNRIEDILPLVNNTNLGKGVYLFISENPLNEISINEYIPLLIQRGVTVEY